MNRIMTATAFAALAAGTFTFPAEAVPASKMKIAMAEIYVKKAESGVFGKPDVREARQRVDDLKKNSADDPAVIALDERMKAVEGKIQAKQDAAVAANKAEREKREAEEKAKHDAAIAANKAAREKRKAEEKAPAEAASAPPAAPAHATELPWAMNPAGSDWEFSEKVREYVKTLGVQKNEDVVAFDKQLRARAEEDRKIVAAGGAGADKAKDELGRYYQFLSELDSALTLASFDGSVNENGDVAFRHYQMRTKNSSVRVQWEQASGKYFFYETDGKSKAFLDDADVNLAKFTANQLYYASVFADNVQKDYCRKLRYAGRVSANRIMAAVQNNAKDNVTRYPLPKKGALHAQYAEEALACARQTQSHPDALEAIIDADDWTIDYKFGNPVRRRFGFWVLKNAAAGRKVYRMQLEQPYQGGGKYGKLRYYAVGGGQYYVE